MVTFFFAVLSNVDIGIGIAAVVEQRTQWVQPHTDRAQLLIADRVVVARAARQQQRNGLHAQQSVQVCVKSHGYKPRSEQHNLKPLYPSV
ncbi:MAG: hypothetical protein NWQ26_04280 [Paraglaciecola sp.]|nr:hypothetical protein [Paraglaciecola sp.]